MIFEDSNCRGNSARIDLYSKDKPTYANTEDISEMGIRDNEAASVMVPLGYSLFAYPLDGGQGTPEIITGKPLDQDGVMLC
jgi:hypothetical protein